MAVKTPSAGKTTSTGIKAPDSTLKNKPKGKQTELDTDNLAQDVVLLHNEEHPDYIDGIYADEEALLDPDVEENDPDLEALTPVPGGPLPGPFPGPFPGPIPGRIPGRLPGRLPGRIPGRFPPLNFCSAVSGTYGYSSPFRPIPWRPVPQPLPHRFPLPVPSVPARPARPAGPFIPLPLINIKVRVDVDRFFPQNRISIEVNRRFPFSTAHAIAEVTSDRCLGLNKRKVEANITYRDGDARLIQGDRVIFEAGRDRGIGYGSYKLTLITAGGSRRSYNLNFESQHFDEVEFEVDRVANAAAPTTTYDIGSHHNRPGNLPAENISLQTVYQRAGFGVSMSPNTSVIPTAGAGANSTWSDAEMHNAMVTYWSRFQNRPKWALWVLFARRHDIGRGLGGIMFDDIGANHRQGTAIFTDSFIQDAPAGDPNAAAWRQRMVFWTAIHEMGHAFNLAHSWQKSLSHNGGDPWIPLANNNEARTFMSYPFRVAGGENAFFSDFRFRFMDEELTFMRHAPRRFVQMGNEDWFHNHNLEQDADHSLSNPGNFDLQIRPNRSENSYQFLEPVSLELKLRNASDQALEVDHDLLEDGRHIALFVQRKEGKTRKWRALSSHCHETKTATLNPGEAMYGSHLVSASTDGWTIDEPGFYNVQAVVDIDGEIVSSNVLSIYVNPPASKEESRLAPDYFTEDVGRALSFAGAPSLDKANDVLRDVVARCAKNPAARHADLALSAPMLRDFKVLNDAADKSELGITSIKSKIDQGAKSQIAALVDDQNNAADTLGHIRYYGMLDQLATAMSSAGDERGANRVLKSAVSSMKTRKVLGSVIKEAEKKINT